MNLNISNTIVEALRARITIVKLRLNHGIRLVKSVG